MLEKILKKAGLGEKEIKIYLAGLKEERVLANFLAKKTGVSRQNTYDILRKLEKKGLVSKTGEKYGTRFTMEPPKNIERLLDKKKRELDKTKKELELAMPELDSMTKSDIFFPKIKFYEGKENMENLFLNSLNCQNKMILAITPSNKLFEALGVDFIKDYVQKRAENNIKTKTIRLRNTKNEKIEYFNKHTEQLREARYAPEKLNFDSTVFIYDNKSVFISSKKENFGLVIESVEYREMMEELFNSLWEQSKIN